MKKDSKNEVKFDNGEIMDYDDSNWAFAAVTHWRLKHHI